MAANVDTDVDIQATQVAGSGPRLFTVVVSSAHAGGGNGVACIKVVLPATYTLAASGAVKEFVVSSGEDWSTAPTVTPLTRTIQWAAIDSENDLDDGEWARLTFEATVPASSTTDWTVEAWQNLNCSGGGGNRQQYTPAVVVGANTRTYSSVLTPATASTGTTPTFKVQIALTGGGADIQSAFVVIPTCLTNVSGVAMSPASPVDPNDRSSLWAATLVDNAIRLNRVGGAAINNTNDLENNGEFVQVAFNATVSCAAGSSNAFRTAAADALTGLAPPGQVNDTLILGSTGQPSLTVDAAGHDVGTLTIDKTGPATAAHGATITYTMDVTYAPGADGSPAQTIVVSDDQCTSAVSAPDKTMAVDRQNDNERSSRR